MRGARSASDISNECRVPKFRYRYTSWKYAQESGLDCIVYNGEGDDVKKVKDVVSRRQ